MSQFFPKGSEKLVDGHIISYYNIDSKRVYTIFPKTGGIFILQMCKKGVQIELVGQLPNPKPNVIGIFGSYEENYNHKMHLYDSAGIYSLSTEKKKKQKVGNKLTKV